MSTKGLLGSHLHVCTDLDPHDIIKISFDNLGVSVFALTVHILRPMQSVLNSQITYFTYVILQ